MGKMLILPLQRSLADPAAVSRLAARGVEYVVEGQPPTRMTSRSCNDKRLWRCLRSGHTWEAACYNVTSGGGCPFPCCCTAPKQLCASAECSLCFRASVESQHNALAVRGVEYVVEGQPPARLTSPGCNDKRLWRCLRSGHTWEAACHNVTRGCGCPFPCCCASPKQLCVSADCTLCFRASVESQHDVLAVRGVEYVGEGQPLARLTSQGCHDKRLWRCLRSGHTWEAACHNVTSGGGCPFPCCCAAPKQLCASVDCTLCFRASVESQHNALAARGVEYVVEGQPPTRMTSRSCNDKRLWRCLRSGHTWEAKCYSVTSGRGCPFPCCCASPKQLCVSADCTLCFRASVESQHDVLSVRGVQYVVEGQPPARITSQSCNDKRLWRCLRSGHTWEAICGSVTSGSGCPHCVNKTEELVRKWLASLSWLSVDTNRTPEWLKAPTGRQLQLDMGVTFGATGTACIVEVDGAQHFRSVATFGDSCPRAQLMRDTFKDFLAHKQGISTIRVCQEDIWNRQWPCWQTRLQEALAAASTATAPTQQYLSMTPTLYDAHRQAMATVIATDSAEWWDGHDTDSLNDEDDDNDARSSKRQRTLAELWGAPADRRARIVDVQ